MPSSLEEQVTELARQLAEHAATHRTHFPQPSWWNDRLLGWSMSHPSFKTQLFRFVDVFPATTDNPDVLAHLEEYLEGSAAPRVVDLGLELAGQVPFGTAISATVVRHAVDRMARQFIVGSDPADAVKRLEAMWDAGMAFTVDVLGEKTITTADAERYAERVGELLSVLQQATPRWSPQSHLEADDAGPIARINISVKPTALSPRFAPLTREIGIDEAFDRVRPTLRAALVARAHLHFDMEQYDVRELTFDLVERIVGDAEFDDLSIGVVVQAYLKSSYSDLSRLIALSAGRRTPLTVRLVKGAYWDTETIHSEANGWPVPVFEQKSQTDANFERCVRLLHDHHGEVRAAFGSHNLRSLAYTIAYARSRSIADHDYEIQMLYGMAEPFHQAVRDLGMRLRIYTPVGELVPGMAYLVRRLLENTANESFVHSSWHAPSSTAPLDVERATDLPEPEPSVPRRPTDERAPSPYRPEPPLEWRRAEARQVVAQGVEAVDAAFHEVAVPAVIDGRAVMTSETIDSVDPAHPGRVVARSASAGRREADLAIAAARRAWPQWRHTPADDRAAVLFRAAAWMRDRRTELIATEIFEAGKPWSDADADVCEAIDYCEYYGREMIRLAQGGTVQSTAGETNSLHYVPRGLGVVIAPWNFPLAIPTGMVCAALVTGNAVLFKPAEQTPATAAKLAEALASSGLPDGVLAFLPGSGEVLGNYLVNHPDVSFITFTGSKAVGLQILEQGAVVRPGQRQVKRIVAEMGGKNALIIDSDADLDQAVPIVVSSAFGYSGQKCSASAIAIPIGSIYDEFVDRLAGATRLLQVGEPARMATEVGPVIDRDAFERVRGYQRRAEAFGRVVLREENVPTDGWFVGPTIVADVDPSSELATVEIFGPVLTVIPAPSIEEAIEIANRTDYTLTAGIVSRSPAHVALAIDELRAGNVYVNRTITGAVVGRQPFGGFGLSGVGSKAGGPDYLLQFLEPRAMRSENTVRQGFAPEPAREQGDRPPG